MRRFLPFLFAMALTATAHADDKSIMLGGASNNPPVVIPVEDMGPFGLFVPVKIDGHGPYLFSISLGSQTMILNTVADQLSLKSKKVLGLTSGYVADESRQVDTTLAVGDTEFPAHLVYTQPDIFAQGVVRAIPNYGGALGIEMLQDHAIAIDFDAKTLTLSDAFAPPSGAEIVDAVGAGTTGPEGALVQRPAIVADIDGVKATLALSLGNGAISIEEMSPAAKLLPGKVATAKTVHYIGEDYHKDIAVLRSTNVHIGALSLADAIVDVTLTPRNGEHWDPRETIDFDGVIGGSILRRYNIAIDRYGARVAFTPRPVIDDPCIATPPYPDTGFSTAAWSDGSERIAAIVPGSPAERAGLKTGDVVLTRDDAAPGTSTTCTPGARVKLSVRSEGQIRDVALTPAPLFP